MTENTEKPSGSLGRMPGAPNLASRRLWLGDVAIADPVLAWTLLQSGSCKDGYVTGGWEIINIAGSFQGGNAGATVNGAYPGIVEADLWVRKVTYTVRRPNAFAGNVMKAQSDYYNSLNPNIDFSLTINSYCQYLIATEPTPLENIAMAFEMTAPAGIVLQCSARVSAIYTLRRNLAAGENPTEAVISLHTTRLPRNVYGSCQREQAIQTLIAMGYLDAAA